MRQVARLLAEDLFETEDADDEEEHLSSVSLALSAPEGLSGGIRGVGGSDRRGSSLEPSTQSPDRESGVGRGSHLARPAWMVLN